MFHFHVKMCMCDILCSTHLQCTPWALSPVPHALAEHIMSVHHSFMGTDTMCSASVRGTGDNAHGVGVLQRMSRTHILFLSQETHN